MDVSIVSMQLLENVFGNLIASLNLLTQIYKRNTHITIQYSLPKYLKLHLMLQLFDTKQRLRISEYIS